MLPVLGGELRRIAAGLLRGERRGHTLQPTALVNEAWIRLIDRTLVAEADHRRFLGLAARAMRRVLIDHARARRAVRRGGGQWQRVTLSDDLTDGGPGFDVVDLGEVLDRFEAVDPRACRVVELRFFAGLSFEEIAEALEVTSRTAYKDWAVARVWLARALGEAAPP